MQLCLCVFVSCVFLLTCSCVFDFSSCISLELRLSTVTSHSASLACTDIFSIFNKIYFHPSHFHYNLDGCKIETKIFVLCWNLIQQQYNRITNTNMVIWSSLTTPPSSSPPPSLPLPSSPRPATSSWCFPAPQSWQRPPSRTSTSSCSPGGLSFSPFSKSSTVIVITSASALWHCLVKFSFEVISSSRTVLRPGNDHPSYYWSSIIVIIHHIIDYLSKWSSIILLIIYGSDHPSDHLLKNCAEALAETNHWLSIKLIIQQKSTKLTIIFML